MADLQSRCSLGCVRTWVDPRNHVLGGAWIPKEKWHLGSISRPILNYREHSAWAKFNYSLSGNSYAACCQYCSSLLTFIIAPAAEYNVVLCDSNSITFYIVFDTGWQWRLCSSCSCSPCQIQCFEETFRLHDSESVCLIYTMWGKKQYPKLIHAVILSNLNWLSFFSPEDSLLNLQ